ncbi:MAG: DUF2520 domain-containing protein [Paludibacteraceae bacterium]|nr:DUF2520 domain-containing protein [Paludibacteraceae bacterium]
MSRIVFIGAGNLAVSLSGALQRAGHSLLQVYSRTEASARALAGRLGCEWTVSSEGVRPDAEVYIYALRDTAYPFHVPVSVPSALHLLTSGSVPFASLSGAARAGVLYPFQTFSKEQPVEDFSEVPILVEAADAASLEQARTLARSVSHCVFDSTPESRARLHLAGVLANNFANCLYALAGEQLQKAGLPFDILLPLIDETARKVHTLSPREAQTGPAVRGDKTVMDRQLLLLPDERLRTIYRILSENIQQHRI